MKKRRRRGVCVWGGGVNSSESDIQLALEVARRSINELNRLV